MRALKQSLVLALSIAVVSTIGLAGCGSSSKSNNDGGTGGASAAGGSSGSGGSSVGGNTGSGGKADAGSDVHTGAGGTAGQDSGAGSPNCTALLACCNMATGPLKTFCMGQYTTAVAQGDSACAADLAIAHGYGVCN
jgi:hypothetical protein